MADTDFQDFIERVKSANPIEDVIEATGPEFKLQRKRGGYLRGETHDSLVVRTDEQYYVWNRRSEKGDVFNWLECRHRWDFWNSLQFLAERAHIEMPARFQPREGEQGARVAARAREDAFAIAQQKFRQWLVEDSAALDYVKGRGWSEETIWDSGIGFSGRATAAEVQDMRGEFSMYGIDPESPQAVAILGYRGDVKRWGEKWNVAVQENWIDWGFIPGLMGKTRLVYPHWWGGRVKTFSARNILGAEVNREGRELKSFNLPVALSGPRQLFFNHEYGRRADECVIVEGQADAITLAQWGLPAVALAGTAWGDHQEMLGKLKEWHPTLYLGMDADDAGMEALIGREKDWPLARTFGPMCRIVKWGTRGNSGELRGTGGVKDANDWLKVMVAEGVSPEDQVERVRGALTAAAPMAVAAASWAGRQRGAAQDEAIKVAFRVISEMDPLMTAKYRERLAEGMGVGIREFNNMLKQAKGEKKGDEEAPGEIVETLGGYIGGYLIEYMYDEEEEKASFAYRDPEGKVKTANFLDIDGVRYVPKTPNSLIRNKGVLFPSKLENLRQTRELVAIVEAFIHQHYLLDDKFFGRMAAYYVLLTWLYDCFNAIPYLRAMGDYGSGKSELMKRIGHVCYRMMATGGAGTAASLFRALEEYKGTAFMDEMDLSDGGDMANDLIKILNMGAMKGSPIWRLNEFVNANGTRDYEVTGYNIFGPKLIAMRKDFKDDAVSSRCLTVNLMGKEAVELKERGIKLHLNEAFYRQALGIRNLLLRWRLDKWQEEIEVGEDLMDIYVPARLNQVTMPLKAIAREDPELMRDIQSFVRALNDELIMERSVSMEARVLDALVAIREDSKYSAYLFQGDINGHGISHYCYTKHVSKVANDLMDEMNVAEGEEEENAEQQSTRKRPRGGTTAHTVGRIARKYLQLPASRKKEGYVIIYDDVKMKALKMKFGLMRPDRG